MSRVASVLVVIGIACTVGAAWLLHSAAGLATLGAWCLLFGVALVRRAA